MKPTTGDKDMINQVISMPVFNSAVRCRVRWQQRAYKRSFRYVTAACWYLPIFPSHLLTFYLFTLIFPYTFSLFFLFPSNFFSLYSNSPLFLLPAILLTDIGERGEVYSIQFTKPCRFANNLDKDKFNRYAGSSAVEHAVPVLRTADHAGPASPHLPPTHQAYGALHL
jgi:hypothetical protein